MGSKLRGFLSGSVYNDDDFLLLSDTTSMKPFIILDGSSWLYRAYHAMSSLTNSKGQATGAIFGMGTMVKRLLLDHKPTHVCAVFDPRGRTWRHTVYPYYKDNRDAMPTDLESQFPHIVKMLGGMGISVLSLNGVEADDVIGSMTRRLEGFGYECLIATGDKDMAQLVNNKVKLLDTMKNVVSDLRTVKEKFGVAPDKIVELLALTGDAGDNVPGIPGVGYKTAIGLIEKYGSVERIIASADKIPGKLGERIRDNLSLLPLSKFLVTIRTDVPIPFTVEQMKVQEKNVPLLKQLYHDLEIERLKP